MQDRDQISAVFFDVGDTLLRAHPSWSEVYASVFPDFGLDIALADFTDAWRQAFVNWGFEGPFEASEEASYQRFKELDGRIFAKLGCPDLPDEFYRAIERAFADRSAWHVFPDVLPALDVLRDAGLRLGVISNWGWAAPELLHDLELAAHFESLAISARLGYQKPHARIFQHALGQLGVEPQQALHVGDSLGADVKGARAVGLTAVLIDRYGNRAGSEGASLEPPVPVISDLGGLLELLGLPAPLRAASR